MDSHDFNAPQRELLAATHGHDAMAVPKCTTRDEKRAGIKAKRLFKSIHKVVDLDESLALAEIEAGVTPYGCVENLHRKFDEALLPDNAAA